MFCDMMNYFVMEGRTVRKPAKSMIQMLDDEYRNKEYKTLKRTEDKRGLYAIMRYVCVRVCVCVCVCHVRTFCQTNKDIFEIFSPSGSQAILVFPYQTAWQYSDGNPPNGGVECRWGRQKSGFSANILLLRTLWTLRRRAAINMIVGRYLAIDRSLLELVLSTDGGLWYSLFDTESHAPVNTPKRREHSLIYAALNLTRECN